MYEDNFPPLTFADLTRAVQRESWGNFGLGQVTCPDGSSAPDALSCLPVNTNTGANILTQGIQNTIAAGAESPYYINVLGAQIPLSTAIIGGLIGLVAIGAVMGGRR